MVVKAVVDPQAEDVAEAAVVEAVAAEVDVA